MSQLSELKRGLSSKEYEEILKRTKAFEKDYREGEDIFRQMDEPKYLYVLLKGSIMIENIDFSGKRTLVNIFTEPETVFGEVYLFLSQNSYDYSCKAHSDARILCIPKGIFFKENPDAIEMRMIRNLLIILAEKAHFMNQKLLIVNSSSIRAKLIKYLLRSTDGEELVLRYKREELANYLGIPRPSLSRELMHMQDEGLIHIEGKTISFSRELIKKHL